MRTILALRWTSVLALSLTATSAGALGQTAPGKERCAGRPRTVQLQDIAIATCERGTAGPLVVFESGLGEGLDAWNAVGDSVSRFARALTYDRPGIGESSRAMQGFSAERAAQVLAQLLDSMRVTEPMILVAHSLGAAYAQTFAARSSGRLAGLVLVDPTPPGFFQRQRAVLGDSLYLAMQQRGRGALQGVAAEEWDAREESLSAALSLGILGAGRAVVLSAGRVENPDTTLGRRVKTEWLALHREMGARIGARHEVVADAGHRIQAARPDRVVNAIREVVGTRGNPAPATGRPRQTAGPSAP